ncbi:hypothetical protein CW354_13275 [Marinicaulis flavus]|uniref:DUF1501 domain-containing protein n=2 Tax=Hyphococcus luteus TaxID=2058213 RepID=A0A2S7K3Y4_9PROT|nr:hypothetical protein CW354_13275 [Marinicaulis flavus]
MTGGAGFALDLARFNAFAAQTGGYRALVCVFLFGGMDCHDTVIPYDTTNYNRYADIRSSLFNRYDDLEGGSTRARDRLLPMTLANASDFGGRQFALPPELGPLHELMDENACSIVSNVGPLVVPVTRDDYQNRSAPLPPRLFSHNDQQSVWMASQPEGARFGWGGRLADVMLEANANQDSTFTVVSTSGNQVFLSGQLAGQFEVGSNGPAVIRGIDDDNYLSSDALPALYESHLRAQNETLSNLLQRDYASAVNRSIDANRTLAESFEAPAPFATVFPQNYLGQQLQVVARVIAQRAVLGVNRQIFFVGIGGFDSHSGQANSIPNRHGEIASAMRAFYDATVEMGVGNDVTAFTASDFGRTLTVNRDGTDHGWGAHHLVVGGGLAGSRMHGTFPEPVLEHAYDSGNGRLIPTTSVDQFAATFGRWFGLNDTELDDALPGLSNFSTRDIGLFTGAAI